jgi:hypothetical protein
MERDEFFRAACKATVVVGTFDVPGGSGVRGDEMGTNTSLSLPCMALLQEGGEGLLCLGYLATARA